MSIPANEMHEAAAEVRKRGGSGLRQRREYLSEPVPLERGDLPVSYVYLISTTDECDPRTGLTKLTQPLGS